MKNIAKCWRVEKLNQCFVSFCYMKNPPFTSTEKVEIFLEIRNVLFVVMKCGTYLANTGSMLAI